MLKVDKNITLSGASLVNGVLSCMDECNYK